MQEARAMLQSDINVTPLVDVCLVLLIIFMLVLPAMVNGVEVKLPEMSSTTAGVEERVLPVMIKQDGSVYVGDLVIRRDEVPSTLQKLRETESVRPIAVRADKRVEYGEVAGVLRACRDAGWQEVTLVSSRPASAAAAARTAIARRRFRCGAEGLLCSSERRGRAADGNRSTAGAAGVGAAALRLRP
jgi:biopolymer transport protein ExbD